MSTFRRPVGAAAAGDAIPFAVDGRLHLFYLSSPPGTLDYPERVRTSWQHVTTEDLQQWTELPLALEPGPSGTVDARFPGCPSVEVEKRWIWRMPEFYFSQVGSDRAPCLDVHFVGKINRKSCCSSPVRRASSATNAPCSPSR